MNVKCPHCGTEYEAGKDELFRYTKCSVCGKGFVAGATTSLQAGNSVAEPPPAPPPQEEAPPPGEEPRQRPKLTLRKPTVAGNGENGGGMAVAAVEARYKEQRRRERIAKIKRLAGSIFSLLILFALLFGGYKAWQIFRGTRHVDVADVFNKVVGRNSDMPGEEEKQKEEGVSTRMSEPASSRTESTPEPKASEKDRFKFLASEFENTSLSFWRKLDKAKRPGAIDGAFVAIVPKGRKMFYCYEILSSRSGITNIVRFAEETDGVQVALSDFEKQLNANGGFVLDDAVSYLFRPKSSRKDFQAPQRGCEFNPAAEYLGALAGLVSDLRIGVGSVSYKVSFAFSDDAEPVEVATVRHGDGIPYEAFRKVAESIAKDINRKAMSNSLKIKKYKRTVIFYDGQLIAKGFGGVTKIPRSWPRNRSTGYLEWVRLRDEAYRQESEAQRVSQDNKRREEEWRRNLNSPPDPSLVQKVLYSGKVFITAMVEGA